MGFIKKKLRKAKKALKAVTPGNANPKQSFRDIKRSFKSGNPLDPISTISEQFDPGVKLTHSLYRKGTGQDLDPASRVNLKLSKATGSQGQGFFGNKPATKIGLDVTAMMFGGGFSGGGAGASGGGGGGMGWTDAIGPALSVGSQLLSKSGGSSTSVKDPKYLKEAKKDVIRRGTAIADRPYQRYTGPRIAGLSDNERSALELAGRGSAESRKYLTRAGEELDKSALEYNAENLKGYMNPYIDEVLQPQLRENNRAYERERTRLGNSDASVWGGDRSAFAASELERGHRESISDITNKTYSEAFDAATRNFFTDTARRQAAASSYQKLGEGLSALDTQDIQNLMATGGVERLLRQAQMDSEYADFLEERDWDVNNLDTLLQAIGAASGNTTTTRTDGKAGAAGRILGAGAVLAGMYFGGNKSITSGNQVSPNVASGTAMDDYSRSYFTGDQMVA